jgi:hypothetical protein
MDTKKEVTSGTLTMSSAACVMALSYGFIKDKVFVAWLFLIGSLPASLMINKFSRFLDQGTLSIQTKNTILNCILMVMFLGEQFLFGFFLRKLMVTYKVIIFQMLFFIMVLMIIKN